MHTNGLPHATYLHDDLHGSTLSTYLEHLFTNSTHTDVLLHIHDTIVPAHRIVLSHYSTFFNQIFSDDGQSTVDVFLEGFNSKLIHLAMEFMYTGRLSAMEVDDRDKLIDTAVVLDIPALVQFLREKQVEEEEDEEEKHERGGGRSTGVEEESEHRGGSVPSGKRRKQARPKRHTEEDEEDHVELEELEVEDDDDPTDMYTPSTTPSPSPEDNTVEEDPEEESQVTPPQQPLPLVNPHHHSPVHPHPHPILPSHTPQPPPPHFLFLRNMVHNNSPPPPGPPSYYPPDPMIHHQKRIKSPMWGKVMMGGSQKSSVFHHHGSSRAQHSAPRGGPPRAWSNQDLTEALHNVWNKKMTTSQASRIFGIPYNSLLMYVRGKYGKSLKLDLLKKGLDLALLEKQRKSAATNAPPTTPPQPPLPKPATPPKLNNNVVEWMMSNSGNRVGPFHFGGQQDLQQRGSQGGSSMGK